MTAASAAPSVGHYVALAAAILVGVAGQLLLKAGAAGAAGFVDQLFRWQSIIGLGLYGMAAFLYMAALQVIPVSVAFPSVSISYALVVVLGYFLYGEALGWPQVAGILLICSGIVILFRG
ncbi:multidrug efflux SMR transporter [Stella sp.]|uniref:DMT family transporter n=1 Tax=Stella sp. TaxID=2912054 RepID=UPI0035B33A5E